MRYLLNTAHAGLHKRDDTMQDYAEFIASKTHEGVSHGFDPTWVPECLFPFQRALVDWSVRKGRAAIFADCGLGKTFTQLTWAENVARHTGGRVLVLTPLSVSFQTVSEGAKIGVEAVQRRDAIHHGDRIVVTNYERLDRFDSSDFAGVVCDESSILKNFDGARRNQITNFMRKMPYRLLCTATAAPNDYIELGTSSEALGYLGYADMLSRFFKKSENVYTKAQENRSGLYRFRGHAEPHFWRWVCSWARAVRRPSDMGFDDGAFQLPSLNVNRHVVSASTIRDGMLFDLPAVGLQEQRADLRRSIGERCDMAAQLANGHDNPVVVWCNLNEESTRLTRAIRGAVEVCGADSDDEKEARFAAFIRGDARVLVTKPTIAGFGLNLQHCAHQTFFPSHSYEQYYQAVRRCWRFGQKRPVTVDIVTTTGQSDVMDSLSRKTSQSSAMFDQLVAMMWQELKIAKKAPPTVTTEIPTWL